MSSKWREARKNILTSSNFGRMIKRREKTPCHNIIKELMHGRELHNKYVIYGRQKEVEAIKIYEELTHATVAESGLILSAEHPFLGTSLGGLVGDDLLIEVKSFPYIGNLKFKEAVGKNICFEVIDGEIWCVPTPYEYNNSMVNMMTLVNFF